MSIVIEATYRVLTPLFCAGTDPNRPELRLPSFKGVLRFWWRALAWPRLGGDLGAIQRAEEELFGSAGGGQSKVLMRLANAPSPPAVKAKTVLKVSGRSPRVVGEGARYLGYGVIEAYPRRPRDGRPETKAGQLTRACLRAPFDFTVQLRCRDLNSEAVSSLTDALKAVGLLGGMGAKSRKGYGSLVLRSLQVLGGDAWSAPTSLAELRQTIVRVCSGLESSSLPEYTALSGKTRHVLLMSEKGEPVELLDLVGRELVRYRSWGHNGKVLGTDSERNFKDDHDLMKSTTRKSHPRRVAFGLPHNYGKPNGQQVGPHDKHLDRRASPLFIHIHECGGTPVALLSFLPARFLPEGRSDISVGGTKIEQKPEDDLYEPIHDFLDRLLDSKRRREPFTETAEVRP
jgi:CRISPR-associated protein Cmr1